MLAFDRDATDQQMQREVINLANDQQIKVQKAILDQGKDWNQALQNQLDLQQPDGIAELCAKELLAKAKDLYIYWLNKDLFNTGVFQIKY